MRYWDTSALVPLIVREPSTERLRALMTADGGIVTWAWTRVELASAVERRARAGFMDREQRRAALDECELLAATWDEVSDLAAVRVRAIALLARHSLRAADAAQLGAALFVAEQGARGLSFVCLDERLARAAEREGLRAS